MTDILAETEALYGASAFARTPSNTERIDTEEIRRMLREQGEEPIFDDDDRAEVDRRDTMPCPRHDEIPPPAHE